MKTLEAARELTIYQVAELKKAWLAAYADGIERVDLSQVAEIDASGAQLLAALWRMAARDGRTLQFVDPSDVLLDVLSLLGAQRLLQPAAGSPHADATMRSAAAEARHA